jgi:hypothetical protein
MVEFSIHRLFAAVVAPFAPQFITIPPPFPAEVLLAMVLFFTVTAATNPAPGVTPIPPP